MNSVSLPRTIGAGDGQSTAVVSLVLDELTATTGCCSGKFVLLSNAPASDAIVVVDLFTPCRLFSTVLTELRFPSDTDYKTRGRLYSESSSFSELGVRFFFFGRAAGGSSGFALVTSARPALVDGVAFLAPAGGVRAHPVRVIDG